MKKKLHMIRNRMILTKPKGWWITQLPHHPKRSIRRQWGKAKQF